MFNFLLTLIYICFISLGLPDSLLGSAWPIMHQEIGVPIAYAGIISTVISLGTVVSSLMSGRMIKLLGSGKLTAISIAMIAIALFEFSISGSFWLLILWSVPYGLGAGGVDAALNNYVALHYKAQHMSWLHCFWGLGASISPYIMSFALVRLDSWSSGYLIVSVIQIILSVFIFASLPAWRTKTAEVLDGGDGYTVVRIKDIISIPGAVPCLITFFAYCGFEVTASLWASSYLVDSRGVAEQTASAFASLFYIGITVGRAINGFLSMKFGDKALIRMGFAIISVGIALMLIPSNSVFALVGLVIIGLGCAPIYPCIIHMTPSVFGRDKSQSMVGFQMAFAYIGFCLIPPLFGIIAQSVTIALLPACLLALLVLMAVMHQIMVVKTKARAA